ncbi:uncharacterized protein LOC127241696 [Andrographis paniculata]|uniref:uncharacterized protein LOC127241696 n=1 Tax=Andrographis paniculata TaxID=175694 RepID=UPI0021E8E8D2|nr:uncharacterized protein LOC127241696 [Andrographis paniculata]
MSNSVSTMFKYSPSEVPIFEGDHYNYWSSEMQDFFISHDLWDIVADGFEEPPVEEKKEKNAWDVLKEEFHGNDKVISIRLQSLWRDFDNLAMKENENVSKFFTRVVDIVNHIESLGDTIQSKKDCWYQKKGQTEANFLKEQNAESETLFYTSVKDEDQKSDLWYLDSGCSSHMTSNESQFEQLDRSCTSHAKLGDGNVQSAEGKGTIALFTKGGHKKLIHDVLYVPNLVQNLLSVGQLIQSGYSVIFCDGIARIFTKNNDLVAEVEMSANKVFLLPMPSSNQFALKN